MSTNDNNEDARPLRSDLPSHLKPGRSKLTDAIAAGRGLHPLARATFDHVGNGGTVVISVNEDGFFKPGAVVDFVDVSRNLAHRLRVLSTAPGTATLINDVPSVAVGHVVNLSDVDVDVDDYFVRVTLE